jgi:hypothetical protein
MAQRVFLRLIGAACAIVWLAGCAQTQGATADTATQALALDAGTLVGSTPAILNAEFGQPVLRRIDGSAQVWLYHSSVCGLDLILYPDRAGVPRVADAVPDNGDPARCVESLQRSLTSAALAPPASS